MKTYLVLVTTLICCSLGSASSVAVPAPCSGEVRQFVIEVTSVNGDAVRFKGAVGHSGEVKLVEGVTPYRLELAAARIVAMFSSLTEGARLTAALYSLQGGKTESVGSITEISPLILESVSCPAVGREFGRL